MSDTNTLNSEDLIDEMYTVLERAWSLPLGHGRTVVDGDEIRQILDELRDSLPREVQEARRITADRERILKDARQEAESIVHVAEERRDQLLDKSAVAQAAQQRANEMLALAQKKAREIRKAGNDYVEDLLRRTDENLSANLSELRKTRQNVHNAAQSRKKKR